MPSVKCIRSWAAQWAGLIEGVFLVGIGLLGYLEAKNPLAGALSEAAVVAGILTITVDPFLKRRLLKEASQDIFHHLLGFGLPLPIQERIKQIVQETAIYRQDMEMTCSLNEVNGGVSLDCELKFKVVNPSYRKRYFKQILQFEKWEYPDLLSVSYSESRDYGKYAPLTARKGEEEVLEYQGPAMAIPPHDSKERWFRSHFTVRRPIPGFWVQNFGYPTIGFVLRLRSKPEWLRVTATPADTTLGGEWIYRGLFMPGEHIQVRWERQDQHTNRE